MQKAIQKYHRAFVWKEGDEEGEAYEFLVQSLQRRLYNANSRFRRRLGPGDGRNVSASASAASPATTDAGFG